MSNHIWASEAYKNCFCKDTWFLYLWCVFYCLEPALMEDDEDKEEPAPLAAPKPAAVPAVQSALDLTAEFLHPLLTPENVANLVSV